LLPPSSTRRPSTLRSPSSGAWTFNTDKSMPLGSTPPACVEKTVPEPGAVTGASREVSKDDPIGKDVTMVRIAFPKEGLDMP
jgi:hypothetical protein